MTLAHLDPSTGGFVYNMENRGWDPDSLRTAFTLALSDMYRREVPLYSTLVEIVHQVDAAVYGSNALPGRHELERHGAIRLGTEQEIKTIRRLFAIMGMHPVGYYDLSVVGFPLHATAFRPIDEDSLRKNPFRVFTTMLRKDKISSPEVRKLAEDVLSKRHLFSARLLAIMDLAENLRITGLKSTLSTQDAQDFVIESLEIFRWHSRSNVSFQEYRTFQRAHPMIADIVCFPSAHINHLTPRTLDIDLVQQEMLKRGLPAKDHIEGPPGGRKCPILLRQTSFKALEEKVIFCGGADRQHQGTHTARFGEVEQRGAAVTRKGRLLYDELVALARQEQKAQAVPPESQSILSAIFERYPDEWEEIRTQGLGFFTYRLTSLGQAAATGNFLFGPQDVPMERLLSQGLVEYEPITYEDFLPFSAAGIFTSNLATVTGDCTDTYVRLEKGDCGKRELERALGCPILDDSELYAQMQQRSIHACAKALGLKNIAVGGPP